MKTSLGIREDSVGGNLILAHNPYRDSVIWGVMSGSPSLLPSLHVGSALFLFYLIIPWENPSFTQPRRVASDLGGVPDLQPARRVWAAESLSEFPVSSSAGVSCANVALQESRNFPPP